MKVKVVTCKFDRLIVLIAIGIISMHKISYAQEQAKKSCDKVLICHKGKNTLCIDDNAVKAHLAHGDYLGSCGDACGVLATGGTITCSNPEVQLSSISNTSGVTYSWTGPNNFSSTQPFPTVNKPGIYTLTINDAANGCSASDTALVSQTGVNPDISATGGNITCTNSAVTITGSSLTSGVTYNWSGPNGFISSAQNPTVSIAGIYNLTVTNPANGCTSTAMAKVSSNTTAPGATATGGKINCTNTSVTLLGSSSASGVSFTWSGPGNFASSVQNPVVSLVGTYLLTVTDLSDGCSSSDTAEVTDNKILPGALSDVNGILTCNRPAVILSGNSGTSGVNYRWKGPLTFVSTEQNPVTSSPGTYTLAVSNPVNGCTSSDSVIVLQDTSTARGVAAMVSSTLNCLQNSVILTGSSTTSEVTFSWSGPNGFISTDSILTVYTPGNYIFHVCKKSTGCMAFANVVVLLDTIKPKGVVASASGVLGCTRTSVILTGSSTTDSVNYKWAGPDFASTEAITNVTNPGTYSLTVTNPVNHCYTLTTVNVIKDPSLPAGVKTAVSGKLTCVNPNTTISATSTTLGVVYSWQGPGNYNSNEKEPNVNKPGIYLVTVTDPYNDCKVSDSIKVQQNITYPEGVNAYVTGLITCSNKTVTLWSSSLTPGVIYSWTGPYGYSSTMQNPKVSSSGTYTLNVIDTINGCKTDTSLIVNQNKESPGNVTATVSNALDCVNAFVTLTGTSTTSGAAFNWTGPDGFEETSDITFAITPGVYTLKVTDPKNGCSDSATVTVVLDTTPPVCILIPPDSMPVALSNSTLYAQTANGISYLWGLSSANSHWYILSRADSSALVYHSGDPGSSATFSLTTFSISNSCSNTKLLTLSAVSLKSSILGTVTQVYPNPFTEKAYIKLTHENTDYITVRLYSLQGVPIRTLFEGAINGNTAYTIEIDGSTMAAGVYYFIVSNEKRQEIISNKIVLIK
jgi:hypothetical protein